MIIGLYSAIGLLLALQVVFIFKLNKTKKENTDLKKTLIEVYRDGLMETDQAKEDFIKFISDSREWAFDYIENVQKELEKFISIVDHDIEYFNEFGIVASASPHYEPLKKIAEAYKEIKILLPDEKDNR